MLRLLSRKEIEVLVQNGKPFLFKDGEESARKLRLFLGSAKSNVSVGGFLFKWIVLKTFDVAFIPRFCGSNI